jgi:hypothetical protein
MQKTTPRHFCHGAISKKKSFLCVSLLLDYLCVSFSDCIEGCLGCLRTGDCSAQLGVVVSFFKQKQRRDISATAPFRK